MKIIRTLITTIAMSTAAALSTAATPHSNHSIAVSVNPSKFLFNDFDIQLSRKLLPKLSAGLFLATHQPIKLSLFNSINDGSTNKIGVLTRYHFNEAFETGAFIGLKATRDKGNFESMQASNGPNTANSCEQSFNGYALDTTLGYATYASNFFHSEIALGYRLSSLHGSTYSCASTGSSTNLGMPQNGIVADIRIGFSF